MWHSMVSPKTYSSSLELYSGIPPLHPFSIIDSTAVVIAVVAAVTAVTAVIFVAVTCLEQQQR